MSISRRSFLAGLASCPLCAGAARAESTGHWTYEGHGGPKEWGSLSKAYEACALGSQQSPVNLEGGVGGGDRNPLSLSWAAQPFKVGHNGHTIQADALTPANTLLLDRRPCELKQFQFHGPSEHALRGQHTVMEAHFVHADAKGSLAVVGACS